MSKNQVAAFPSFKACYCQFSRLQNYLSFPYILKSTENSPSMRYDFTLPSIPSASINTSFKSANYCSLTLLPLPEPILSKS